MKIAVTIINTVQTGMDNYKDVKITKVFNDNQTIFEIKDWIRSTLKIPIPIAEISLGSVEISDLDES